MNWILLVSFFGLRILVIEAEERSSAKLKQKTGEIMMDNVQIEDGAWQKIGQGKYLRPCYFTNWAQYREGRGKFMPEDYLPGLCTHLLYAFGWMNSDFTVRAYDPSDLDTSWSQGMYSGVNQLKKRDPDLKTLLSFGGWTFGTWLFKSMSVTLKGRKTFIDSAIEFVREHDFDGIDIDWEYPRGSEDMENYSLLVKELRLAVEDEAVSQNLPRLLVTAAVSAGEGTIKNAYNIPEISKWFDFVLLMSYDFHGAWEQKTDFNSPLFSRPNEAEEYRLWNIESAANYWVQMGMPKEKIAIGIATYARGWTLKDSTNKDIGAAALGPSKATRYVRESGVAAYYEICEMIEKGAKRRFDAVQQVPYLLYGDQWFSYDDEQSFRIKMKWLKSQGYGGAFVWTLDFDDFNGKCTNGDGKKFPLITIIAEELGGGILPEPTTSRSTPPTPTTQIHLGTYATSTTTSTPSTSLAPPSGCLGKHDGFYANPIDCSRFDLCIDELSYSMSCPENFVFSHRLGFCTKPEISECVSRPPTTRRFVTKAKPTANPNSFQCPGDGFYSDPTSCDHFFRCLNGTAYKFACPGGLCFDSRSKLCHYKENCDCLEE